jgi:hypothetical protein
MTHKSITEQIDILRATGERVSVSREAASDFLQRAGISSAKKAGAIKKETVSRSAQSGAFVVKSNSASRKNKR